LANALLLPLLDLLPFLCTGSHIMGHGNLKHLTAVELHAIATPKAQLLLILLLVFTSASDFWLQSEHGPWRE
jgi:hypothetical protein